MATRNNSLDTDEGQSQPAGPSGVTPSPFLKSRVASLIIATQMGGVDPTQIVGADNFFYTNQSRNAFGRIGGPNIEKNQVMDFPPDQATETPGPSALSHIGEGQRRGEKGIAPSSKGGGDPYAGMGSF